MKEVRSGRLYLLIAVLAISPFLVPLLRGELFRFRDHSDYFVPLRYFTSVELRAGHLPLWNPYSGSGERWLANPQTGLFYPPSWTFLVLPFATAYMLYLALHLLILGLGAFRLFRRYAGTGNALLGAAMLMLSGPVLSLLDVQNVFGSVAWFPFVIGSAIDLRDEQRPSWPRSVPILALIFLAGEPFIAAVAWLIFLLIVFRRRSIGRGMLALMTASLVIAVQLIPFAEMIVQSERFSSGSRASAFRESISPHDLLASAVNPGLRTMQLDLLGKSQQFIPSIYLGSLPILFACLGVVAIVRRKAGGVGWLLLTGTTLLLATAGKVQAVGVLSHMLRMDLNRYPAKFLPLGAIGCIGVAMVGLRSVRLLNLWERVTSVLVGSTILVVALSLFRSPDGFAESLRIGEVALICSIFSVVVLLYPTWIESTPFRATAFLLTICLSLFAAQGLLQMQPFQPVTGFKSTISAERKIARLLPPEDRRIDRRAWLSGYTNLFERYFDAGTAAPVVSERYLALYDLALTHPRLDIVDWLSIGYIFSRRDLSVAGYRVAERERGVALYLNQGALPMMQFFTAVEQIVNPDQAWSRVLSGSFDLRRKALVSSDEPILLPATGPFRAHGFISDLTGTSAVMKVATDRRCLVVLNQLFAEGWRVSVDGRPESTVIVNGLFRGVVVDEGSHRIEWKYRPLSFVLGAILSFAGFAVAVLGWRSMSNRATEVDDFTPESQL